MENISTPRLLLRHFKKSDAPAVARIAGDRKIADTMISVPHPYTIEYFNEWLVKIDTQYKNCSAFHFAITLKSDEKLIGSIELRDIDREHLQAELSLWIGADWWNSGYATEAANAVIEYGFSNLKLNRIYAHRMIRNKTCGTLFNKISMRREGILRQRVIKWGIFEDVALYAIVKDDLKEKK